MWPDEFDLMPPDRMMIGFRLGPKSNPRAELLETREDSQRYEREQFDTVQETIRHLLENEPTVRTFDVHTSTAHKVTAKQAA